MRTGVSGVEWLVWSVLAAIAMGCYSSGGQTKDGQSHWLDRCSTQSDCDDDQICACGVCTIACDDSDGCGASATCEPVEDREACDRIANVTARVCLKTCDSDATCAGSDLSCVSQACVASAPEPIDEPSGAEPMSADGLHNACDKDAAREPLVVRDGETCYDLIMHNGDGASPFEVPLGEALHQTYYAIPWPEDSVATRFGFQQDDTTSLHRALLFDAVGSSDGLLERNVTGNLWGQDAKLVAAGPPVVATLRYLPRWASSFQTLAVTECC